MTALTITYHQAVKAGACQESLDKMRDSDIIGGDWGRFGRDTPIPLTAVWDVLGEADMWWALWAADKRTSRLLASDFAAHVHRFFDCVRPDDTRPRDAISVARAWDAAEAAARAAARDAAEAAAWAAARAAAGAAAWAAARAAARDAAEAAAGAAAGDAAGAAAWATAGAAARAAAWAAAGAAAGDAAWAAARDAAGDAAWDAAWDAARAAAWDAAGDIERRWQIDHIRAVLNGERAAGEVEITMHAPTDAEVTA